MGIVQRKKVDTMTERLKQVLERLEQLPQADQDELVNWLARQLDEREAQTKREAAIARQDAEWDARLDEQLARIERGEHGLISYSEEEFLRALGATDEEMEEFKCEIAGQES